MGELDSTRDTLSKREVAVKMLPAGFSEAWRPGGIRVFLVIGER